MSDQPTRNGSPAARVIEVDRADEVSLRIEPAAQVIVTERTERVTPSEPANCRWLHRCRRRRDRVVSLALAGVAVFFVGWLAVDALAWIAAAFERGTALGLLAAAAVAAGVAGAGAVIGREVTSLFRLKSVEAIHQRLAGDLDRLPPAQARQAIADVLAVVPREREVEAAIEAFQRQAQLHHSAGQQIERSRAR